MKNTIAHTFQYDHSPEAVWAYLTKPELIAQWLMANDFEPVVGHEFKFTTKPMPAYGFNGVVICKVLEVIPCKKLVYSWQGGPGDGAAFTLDTLVTWTLTPTDKGTELCLEHKGFKEGHQAAFAIMDAGWLKNIAEIGTILDTGITGTKKVCS